MVAHTNHHVKPPHFRSHSGAPCLQGLLTQISRPSRPAICIRNLVHPIPPSLFTCNFVWVDATPEKRVLPASGDTDNQHRWPTHAAGRLQASPGASLPGGVAIRGAYPRRRRAPCLGGSCRRVATLPYKPVCGVRLMKLCARRYFVASKRTVLRRRRVRLGGRVKSARRGKSFRRRVFQESRTLSAFAADDERVLLVEIDF